MSFFDEFFPEFSDDSRKALEKGWAALPAGTRDELLTLLPNLPTNTGRLRAILSLARDQLQMSFGTKHNVAIVGPANVGKSTLYNQLIQSKSDQAMVSPIPGTTRTNQTADTGIFTVVDTPGADAVGQVGQKEREYALRAAREADFLVIMFGCCPRDQTNRARVIQGAIGTPQTVCRGDEQDGYGQEVDETSHPQCRQKPWPRTG